VTRTVESYREECPGCDTMMVYVQYGYGYHGTCKSCGFEMND
jgi:hypothetical protein